MLGILNCCPRALPHKHDGLVFPLRERLQRRDIVLVVRIGYRISRLASRYGIAQRCHAAVNSVKLRIFSGAARAGKMAEFE